MRNLEEHQIAIENCLLTALHDMSGVCGIEDLKQRLQHLLYTEENYPIGHIGLDKAFLVEDVKSPLLKSKKIQQYTEDGESIYPQRIIEIGLCIASSSKSMSNDLYFREYCKAFRHTVYSINFAEFNCEAGVSLSETNLYSFIYSQYADSMEHLHQYGSAMGGGVCIIANLDDDIFTDELESEIKEAAAFAYSLGLDFYFRVEDEYIVSILADRSPRSKTLELVQGSMRSSLNNEYKRA
jgi:hypothetical protein